MLSHEVSWRGQRLLRAIARNCRHAIRRGHPVRGGDASSKLLLAYVNKGQLANADAELVRHKYSMGAANTINDWLLSRIGKLGRLLSPDREGRLHLHIACSAAPAQSRRLVLFITQEWMAGDMVSIKYAPISRALACIRAITFSTAGLSVEPTSDLQLVARNSHL
jgi:hypothetical protein